MKSPILDQFLVQSNVFEEIQERKRGGKPLTTGDILLPLNTSVKNFSQNQNIDRSIFQALQ